MSLTDLQRDILVKAAEGIQEGMWCRGAWFTDDVVRGNAESSSGLTDDTALDLDADLADLNKKYRCAEGEIALRTAMAGGKADDYWALLHSVGQHIKEHAGCTNSDLTHHNDSCMAAFDTFSAGQEWARIFREVADA